MIWVGLLAGVALILLGVVTIVCSVGSARASREDERRGWRGRSRP